MDRHDLFPNLTLRGRVSEAQLMTHYHDMQEASHAPAYTSHPYLSLQNPQAKAVHSCLGNPRI